jgi:predicted nucleic acid-binding protein
MNVVDLSAWLEYFSDGPNASAFAKPIESTRSLLVPSLALFEVFKRVSQQRSEDEALRAIAVMEQESVIDLDRATAIKAARLSILHGLAITDSVIATARRHRATLWTQDSDFDGLPGGQVLRQALQSCAACIGILDAKRPEADSRRIGRDQNT